MTRTVRRRRGSEDGATTAEYVGIVGFVAIITVALFAIAAPLNASVDDVISKAFCKISAPFGFGGCDNDDLPDYVPTDCKVKSHEGRAGGSVTILADVGGESGYTLEEVVERTDGGGSDPSYVVRTKGKVGAGYEFVLGGKAEGSAGGSGGSAGASGGLSISGDYSWGKEYKFDSRADADAFIDAYKDNFGEFGATPEGAPEAEAEYYEVGAKGAISGTAGTAEASASQQVVLGLEVQKNGDKKVKMALTTEAAAELGLPIPQSVLQAQAEGKVSSTVIADVTFGPDGNVAGIGGSVQFTVNGSAGVGLNTDSVIPEKGADADGLEALQLPDLGSIEAGRTYNLNFKTSFRRDDGSYDYSSIEALSGAVRNFVTSGQSPTQAQRDAITDQINNHSQVTFNSYDRSEDETSYGGTVKVFGVNLGGEIHMVSIDESLLSGFYYDPVQGLWAENVVCG